MPWNMLRNWLKPSPAKRLTSRPRRRLLLNVETLETRYAPAFTVGPNINITRSLADDAENAIVVNPNNPLNLFATSTGSGARRFSLNGGVTWGNSNFGSIFGGTTAGDEQMAWDTFGNLFVTYFAVDATGALHTVVAVSVNGGASFTLALDTFNSFPPGGFGDQPSIAAGAGSVWVCYDGGPGLNQIIRGAAVTGLGQIGAWSFEFEAPGIDGQFGDIAIGPNGQVFVVYEQEGTGEAPAFIFGNLDPDGLGPIQLGGGLIPSQINIATTNVGTFDVIPAQPNRTIDAEANLAWDSSGGRFRGRLYMVFTDETVDEGNDTDIYITYSDTNGASWSPRVRLNDDPFNGTLFDVRGQFLPAIAVDQTTGNVAVAWYDCRNDPRNTRPEVWMTVSHDGGVTWLPNQRVSQGQSTAPPGGFDFGDYNKATFHAGKFWMAWGDNSNSTGNNPAGVNGALDIYTAMVTVTGAPAPIVPPDAFENNDRSDKATRLRKISSVRSLFASIANKPTRLDQDWYRFRLEGTGTLTVTMTITDKTKDLDMRLWTLTQNNTLVLLKSSTTRAAGATEVITLPYSGVVPRLFIQVYGFAGAESPYQITFAP